MISRWLQGFGLSLALSACLSPTIPLPPPEQPDAIHQGTPGVWTVGGTCQPGAIVTVFDNATGKGVVVEDRGHTGRYSVDVVASKCDSGWVAQENNNEGSSETPFTFNERKAGDPTGGPCTP